MICSVLKARLNLLKSSSKKFLGGAQLPCKIPPCWGGDTLSKPHLSAYGASSWCLRRLTPAGQVSQIEPCLQVLKNHNTKLTKIETLEHKKKKVLESMKESAVGSSSL